MTKSRSARIALVIPTVELGAYWKPVLSQMAEQVSDLRVFTAMPWRGATDDDFWPRGHMVQVGAKRRVTSSGDADSDYGGGVMVLSPAIGRHLAAFRPDVVIASGYSLWTIISLALRPVLRWKVLVLWEGSSPRVDHLDNPRRLALRRRLSLMADALMTNSPGGRDYLVDTLRVPAADIWQVPYMVPDPATLAPRVGGDSSGAEPAVAARPTGAPPAVGPPVVGTLQIVSVGRLEERKGNASLLAAVAGLPDDLRARVLINLIGDGDQADTLRAQAVQLGLADQVTFAGWVPYEQLGAQIAQADLLAFLTHEDTWGMVALEAMAVGTPVLCSRWAGAHALVDDQLVVDPHDVEGVTEALASLLRSPVRLRGLGIDAFARMSRHLPVHAAARLLAGARWAATGLRPSR